MDDFNSFSPDGSPDGLGSSAESAREQSEKAREQSQKAQKQLQKTRRDEKKAKQDNDNLFEILTAFIQNPNYENLIPSVVTLLEKGVPSRYILMYIAVFCREAMVYILGQIEKSNEIHRMDSIVISPERQTFHEGLIDKTLRDWVSFWIQSSHEYICSEGNSVVMTTKMIDILSTSDRQYVRQALSKFFQFFFEEKNVVLPENKALAYVDSIVSDFERQMSQSLTHADPDLILSTDIDVQTLFGN